MNVDKNEFKLVITNVLENAYKYSLKGKVIIKVSLKSDEGIYMIGFSKEDSGIGMSELEISQAFDWFWRGA